MINIKEMGAAIEQIAKEKGLQPERVTNAIETAIAAAYKKEYRKRSEVIRAAFDPKTGELAFVQVKTVVDPNEVRIVEEVPEEERDEKKEHQQIRREEEIEEEGLLPRYIPDRHIFLEEAKMIKPDAVVGEELEFPLETHSDFGRIAAQTAKQVVLQSLRDAERASVHEEYSDKEGEIVSGIIQRFDRGNVFIDLGRAIGIMFRNEAIPGEHYRAGERMRFFVLAVQNDARHPGIVLSRSHPKFVQKLFELEVPEIADGTVEIKSVAREAGSRSKIAVHSKEEGVDPVGSAVGQRGTRVMAVTNELGNEKIDIIEWDEDPEKFLAHAISPAKAVRVEIGENREAKIIVSDDQLSLAIGKGGQNVRLAVRLTGWKIDIRAESNPDEKQEHGTAETELGEEKE
ncbi:transcription termination/antitermination protein NusA [Candidatus Parcubacteria bacterium]|jgi:N utilization substance protein A|nr:MAG: transcription termination/antitermination protein NusA [Candidatus Parcubacteria bacterium]